MSIGGQIDFFAGIIPYWAFNQNFCGRFLEMDRTDINPLFWGIMPIRKVN